MDEFVFLSLIGKKPNFLKSGKHDNKFYYELDDAITSGSAFRAEIINKLLPLLVFSILLLRNKK